jgi:hypothetical protein
MHRFRGEAGMGERYAGDENVEAAGFRRAAPAGHEVNFPPSQTGNFVHFQRRPCLSGAGRPKVRQVARLHHKNNRQQRALYSKPCLCNPLGQPGMERIIVAIGLVLWVLAVVTGLPAGREKTPERPVCLIATLLPKEPAPALLPRKSPNWKPRNGFEGQVGALKECSGVRMENDLDLQIILNDMPEDFDNAFRIEQNPH